VLASFARGAAVLGATALAIEAPPSEPERFRAEWLRVNGLGRCRVTPITYLLNRPPVRPRRELHPLAFIGKGLGFVTWAADRLEVTLCVCAALGLGCDVIYLSACSEASVALAGLADVLVSSQDALAKLIPCVSIPALVPTFC
jgi:hypothetical protein